LTLSVGAPVAYAATISVNTTADELNSDGDCSLREAIEADLGGGSDTLVLGGTSGADTFRLGTVGANLTSPAAREVTRWSRPRREATSPRAAAATT
jgi:CSLREA domain-containing protein